MQDELLRLRSSAMVVASGFRWRRSRWGRNCPVALKEGHVVPGQPEFSVRWVVQVRKTFKFMLKLDWITVLSGLLLFLISVQLSGQNVHPVVWGGLPEVHHKPSALPASPDAQVPLQGLHHRAAASWDDHSVSASGSVLQRTRAGRGWAAQTGSVQGRAGENWQDQRGGNAFGNRYGEEEHRGRNRTDFRLVFCMPLPQNSTYF